MKYIFPRITAALALAALVAAHLAAEEPCSCCAHCGCHNVTKVCRLVPVIEKVPKVEYFCKCEDVCLPGRSKCVGTETVTDCDGHCHQQKVFEPCCGKVFSRVTPGKTTTMVEKCTYKCVVEYVCGKCGAGNGQTYVPVGPGQPRGEAVDHDRPPHWHRSN
jgi:hypothetical protein